MWPVVLMIFYLSIAMQLYADSNYETKKQYYDRNNNKTNDEVQTSYVQSGKIVRKQIECDYNEDGKCDLEINIYYNNEKKVLFDLHDYLLSKRSYMFYNNDVLIMMIASINTGDETYIFFSNEEKVTSAFKKVKDGSIRPLENSRLTEIRGLDGLGSADCWKP